MKVNIEILRATVNRLLDHTKEVNGDVVEVSDDLYWFVPRQSIHVPENEPTGLTLGSLHDDWAEIAAISSGEKEPCGYALVWASSLLRAIGDKTP